MKKIFIFILLVFISISCSKKNPIDMVITESDRAGCFFTGEEIVFGGGDGVYYDADIAEILEGPVTSPPHYCPGIVWMDNNEEKHWGVAVALKEETGIDQHSISYKFLYDDDDLTSPGVISKEFTVQDDTGNNPLVGIIGLPRVAACYFDVSTEYVEISIVFQYKEAQSDPWNLGLARITFNPDNIDYEDNWSGVNPVDKETIIFDDSFCDWIDDTSGSDGAMQPDVSYDPTNGDESGYHGKGDLYIVISWDYDGDSNGQRVYILHFIRDGDDFDDLDIDPDQYPFLIQRWPKVDEQLVICLGYQPRIDIGPWQFDGENLDPTSWRVTVAYTGEDETLFPHFSWFDAGISEYPLFFDVRLKILFPQPAEGNDFMGLSPSLDIGLPGTYFCALAWTQIPTGFIKDANIGYVDIFLNAEIFPKNGVTEPQSQFSSPSVSCLPGGVNDNLAQISYLKTLNPSSFYWFPTAKLLTATTESVEFSNETDIHQLAIADGGLDLISQYTSWHGMSCSAALNNDSFWVLWSSPSDDNDYKSITEVYGTYGKPNQ